MSRFFLHATNVHQGGGKSLLLALLRVIPSDVEIFAQLDERMVVPDKLPRNLTVRFVRPSVLQRLRVEKWLAHTVSSQDTVLCFGNLPPLFKLRGHSIVFLQNRYLIDNATLAQFPLKTRLRLSVERIWLNAKMCNASEYIVQTPSMKGLLEARTRGRIPVRILPFIVGAESYTRKTSSIVSQRNQLPFLYVASGEPHKNHRCLVDAWCLLAQDGNFPKLILTIDHEQFPELMRWIIHKKQKYQLNVDNLGILSQESLLQIYKRVGALIYPSTFESFGMPLIEARQVGLPILASELDYVRDLLDPEETFNPGSPLSIARAVKRFMRFDEIPLPLVDAQYFLQHILSEAI